MDPKLLHSEMQKIPLHLRGGKHDYLYNDDLVSVSEEQSPSQTVEPFFAYGLTPQSYGYDFIDLASNKTCSPEAEGKHIQLIGKIYDGNDKPIHDAVVEVLQADSQGNYATRDNLKKFSGFARYGTGFDGDPQGKKYFQFFTLKPGISKINNQDAPHVDVIIFMRGLLNHLFTRIYFATKIIQKILS